MSVCRIPVASGEAGVCSAPGTLRDSKNDDRLTFNDSQGGTWLEVGIGTDVLLSERTNFYFDIEKTFGGTVKTPYRIEGGFRWEF